MSDNILNIKIKLDGKQVEEESKKVEKTLNDLEKKATRKKSRGSNSFESGNSNNIIPNHLNEIDVSSKKATSGISGLKTAVLGFFALQIVGSVVDYIKETISVAKEAEASFTAFSAVVSAKSLSMSASMQSVSKISREGAVSVSETQKAMQNLLQRGYSINQAEEALNF